MAKNFVEIPVKDTPKTARMIAATLIPKWSKQAASIVPFVIQDGTKNVFKKLWQYCRENYNYHEDPAGEEFIRSPFQSKKDATLGIDCEDFSIIVCCVLLNLGYSPTLRIVDFGSGWQHIYVMCDGIVIDPVNDKFDYEEKFVRKMDFSVGNSGLGGIPSQDEYIIAADKFLATITDGRRAMAKVALNAPRSFTIRKKDEFKGITEKKQRFYTSEFVYLNFKKGAKIKAGFGDKRAMTNALYPTASIPEGNYGGALPKVAFDFFEFLASENASDTAKPIYSGSNATEEYPYLPDFMFKKNDGDNSIRVFTQNQGDVFKFQATVKKDDRLVSSKVKELPKSEWNDFISKHVKDGFTVHIGNNQNTMKTIESKGNNEVNFTQTIVEKLKNDEKLNKVSITKIANSFGITNDTEIKELTEYAIVLVCRDIVRNDYSYKDTYEDLKQFYKSQPNLSLRTSNSILLQQYSTPSPIAYLMGIYCRLFDKNVTVFEPSAGNGLLTIASANLKNVFVNEIDPQRNQNLQKQDFRKVLSIDGSQDFDTNKTYGQFFQDMEFDAIVTNPPFGALNVKDRATFDGYEIKDLDHLMAIRALNKMKDDGKAAIIIGSHTQWDSLGRVQAGKNRIFLNYLYKHYNVDDIVLINGDLFSRQGTSFDIRLILINGRKEKPEGVAPLRNDHDATVEKTFESLFDRVMDVIEFGKKTVEPTVNEVPEYESEALEKINAMKKGMINKSMEINAFTTGSDAARIKQIKEVEKELEEDRLFEKRTQSVNENPKLPKLNYKAGDWVEYLKGSRKFQGEITESYYAGGEPSYWITKPSSDDLLPIRQNDIFGFAAKPKNYVSRMKSFADSQNRMLIQSFLEINEFYKTNNRPPEDIRRAGHIKEFTLFSRLQGIRNNDVKVNILKQYDTYGLLEPFKVGDYVKRDNVHIGIIKNTIKYLGKPLIDSVEYPEYNPVHNEVNFVKLNAATYSPQGYLPQTNYTKVTKADYDAYLNGINALVKIPKFAKGAFVNGNNSNFSFVVEYSIWDSINSRKKGFKYELLRNNGSDRLEYWYESELTASEKKTQPKFKVGDLLTTIYGKSATPLVYRVTNAPVLKNGVFIYSFKTGSNDEFTVKFEENELEAYVDQSKTKFKVGDVVIDTKDNSKATVKKITKPQPNTPFYGKETQMLDIKRENGKSEIFMNASRFVLFKNENKIDLNQVKLKALVIRAKHKLALL